MDENIRKSVFWRDSLCCPVLFYQVNIYEIYEKGEKFL